MSFCPILIGLAYSESLLRRRRELQSILQMMDWFLAEIRYQKRELSQSVRQAANLQSFSNLRFLKDCAEKLDTLTFPAAWARSVEDWNTRIAKDDRQLLASLSHVLGAMDIEGQTASLTHVRQQLQKSLKQAERESTEKGRMARSLGILAGLGVLVLAV